MTFGDFHLAGPRRDNRTAVIPVLPSRDIGRTKALYEALGFACAIAGAAGDYLIIRRDWVELHFWLFPELQPERNTVSAYIRVADADAAGLIFAGHAGFSPRSRYLPPSDKPWGMREAHFIDPDGNLLNIGSPLDHSRWPNHATERN